MALLQGEGGGHQLFPRPGGQHDTAWCRATDHRLGTPCLSILTNLWIPHLFFVVISSAFTSRSGRCHDADYVLTPRHFCQSCMLKTSRKTKRKGKKKSLAMMTQFSRYLYVCSIYFCSLLARSMSTVPCRLYHQHTAFIAGVFPVHSCYFSFLSSFFGGLP